MPAFMAPGVEEARAALNPGVTKDPALEAAPGFVFILPELPINRPALPKPELPAP